MNLLFKNETFYRKIISQPFGFHSYQWRNKRIEIQTIGKLNFTLFLLIFLKRKLWRTIVATFCMDLSNYIYTGNWIDISTFDTVIYWLEVSEMVLFSTDSICFVIVIIYVYVNVTLLKRHFQNRKHLLYIHDDNIQTQRSRNFRKNFIIFIIFIVLIFVFCTQVKFGQIIFFS